MPATCAAARPSPRRASLRQAGIDPALNQVLLRPSQARRVARIPIRVSGAASAVGHVSAANPHDRALADVQACAVRIERGMERVVVRRPDVVVAGAELGVAGIALLEVDGLRVDGIGDEAEAAFIHDAARPGLEKEAALQAPEIREIRPSIAVHVCISRTREEEGGLHDAEVLEAHQAGAVEVTVTGVANTIFVAVALICIRDLDAVVIAVDDAVQIRIVHDAESKGAISYLNLAHEVLAKNGKTK